MDDSASMAALLVASAVGFALFLATVAGAKFRGYTESVPTLPMIVLPLMIAVSLVGAYV
jgi:hypothetical protein